MKLMDIANESKAVVVNGGDVQVLETHELSDSYDYIGFVMEDKLVFLPKEQDSRLMMALRLYAVRSELTAACKDALDCVKEICLDLIQKDGVIQPASTLCNIH